ncbi:polyprenyl synthetase family protein [Streptomyces sp. MNP-20]|uniref:polyprenyl synthetase family protein n=1 Tax=Streptomyces sp. MNP-20 TaxID=2721165 RepID=UPI00155662AC|nr:polyprenyl synthetase family protein [Streptomyces sp. MNP-20]
MTLTPPVALEARPGVELLAEARRLVGPGLRAWGERLPGLAHLWTGYHLGWLDTQGQPAEAAVGKAARPALAVSSARAAGGSGQEAVSAAVAVELVHAFSLVHDDIIDGDALRRHRLTVWKAFGVPAAVLAGDVLLALAHQVLADTPGHAPDRAVSWLSQAVIELVEGEARDVSFETRSDVTQAEYTAMATGKTGALMGCACALGAMAAGAGEVRAAHLADFGRHLGVAFQLADDLLGIFGTPEVTGKPVGGDLAARKKTFPVLAALSSAAPAARQLAALYAAPASPTQEQVRQATAWVAEAGGRVATQRAAEEELDLAFAALVEADPVPAAMRELTTLAQLFIHRVS